MLSTQPQFSGVYVVSLIDNSPVDANKTEIGNIVDSRMRSSKVMALLDNDQFIQPQAMVDFDYLDSLAHGGRTREYVVAMDDDLGNDFTEFTESLETAADEVLATEGTTWKEVSDYLDIVDNFEYREKLPEESIPPEHRTDEDTAKIVFDFIERVGRDDSERNDRFQKLWDLAHQKQLEFKRKYLANLIRNNNLHHIDVHYRENPETELKRRWDSVVITNILIDDKEIELR